MTATPFTHRIGQALTYSDPSGLCIESNSLVFNDDGSYTYTPMGGKECFNWTDHDVTGGNVETPGFDGGYGVKSVPGPITHGPGGAFTGLPPTLGSVAKVAGLVYGSAALGAAAGAAPGLAGSVSSTCLRFAFWCTRVVGAGSAGANAVNETFGGQGAGSPIAVGDDLARAISSQRQLRHVGGTPQWVARGQGGYFNSVDEAQRVLDAVHDGSATILGRTRNGDLLVRVESVTGFNNNAAAGYLNQPTNVFIIKGTARPSVVPTSPGAG